jgi:prephenate dehydratase/chorismate mutase/prephenate dehydratase
MDLESIRKNIDILDGKIIKLLNDRMEKAILSKKFKKEVLDSSREEKIYNKIKDNAQTLLDGDFLLELYKSIITESKNLQSKDLNLIAFQGEHGAYSEVAAKSWASDFVPMPCMEFADVFEGVKNGLYDYGIVPVENTLGGIVSQVNDLMIHTDLFVVGAIEIPIAHCLVTYPGADYREIREVYSHVQALAQCRRFLARNKLTPVQYYDTAGAAKMLSEKGIKNTAAISSKLAAQLYNLEIIKESVEDHDTNRTRFLVLSKIEKKEAGSKCSIVFSTAHKSGTLFRVLEQFAAAELNLTRIESIPNEKGTFAFFLDFLGSKEDEKVKEVLKKVEDITDGFRMLGCYNEESVK